MPAWAANPRWPQEVIDALKRGEKLGWFFTPARKRAVELKRQHKADTVNGVTLAERCYDGNSLLAGIRSGRSKPWRLDRPTIGVVYPKTARIDTRALWRLRGSYLLALEWIAFAHVVMKKKGLCVTFLELGAACGVGKDRMYQVVRTLRHWKLVRQGPSFPRYGKVSVQRANCYQLTNVAAHAFGLPDPDCYPEPDEVKPVAAKRAKKAAAPAPAEPEVSVKTTSHPEPPSLRTTSSQIAQSIGSSDARRLVVSASPTIDFCRAVPDEPIDESHRERRQGETCQVFQPAPEPESAESCADPASSGLDRDAVSRPVGDVVRDIGPGRKPTDRRSEPGSERDRERVRHENTLRKQEYVREDVEERERHKGRAGGGGKVPVLPGDDRLERLRRERERLEGERSSRTNAPVMKRPPPDDDFADVLEGALRAYRKGADPNPIELTILSKLRRGDDGKGGAS